MQNGIFFNNSNDSRGWSAILHDHSDPDHSVFVRLAPLASKQCAAEFASHNAFGLKSKASLLLTTQ
jgi:hypothetical protein